jgi:hypothetical protein
MRNFFMRSTRQMLLLFFIGVCVLPFPTTAHVQETKVVEPETIGVIYWRDPANNTLVPLDRQTAATKASGAFTVKIRIQLKGQKASVRLKADPKPEFIVQLANGVDPNKFRLYPFKISGDKRESVVGTASAFGGTKLDQGTFSFNVTKYGQNSYKLIPTQPLPEGEYAFNAPDSNEAFCFGIDVAK